MKIKTTTAFTTLNARRADARNGAKTHMVKSVTKSGAISKAAPTATDWQLNAFGGPDAAALAEARRQELERLNPGCRFVVVEL